MFRVQRACAAAGVAVVGVTVGHWLAYLIAVPSGAQRGALLERTGHGSTSGIVLTAVAIVALAWVLMVRDRIRDGNIVRDPTASWPRFFVAQAGVFVGIELVERLASEGHLHGSMLSRGLLVGLVAQAAVAWLAVGAWRWLCRAADAVARAFSGDWPTLADPARGGWADASLASILRSPATPIRGPPVCTVAS